MQGIDRSYYDVVIVGSGPAGACLGYYLVKKGRKVLTLEKKSFPRDKICGDALCKTGIEILKEMGLYDKLLKENKAHIVSYAPQNLKFVIADTISNKDDDFSFAKKFNFAKLIITIVWGHTRMSMCMCRWRDM